MEVSVIILTYNQERYIAQTIESVLAQKCDFDWEIIIGDDASTDSTPQICKYYADLHPDRIHLIHREKNLGLLRNYYSCLLAARGKFISDIGGDDFWIDDHKLARQVSYLNSHPGCVMVHTAYKRYIEPSGEVESPKLAGVTDVSFMTLLQRKYRPMPVHLCTAMYRREAAVQSYNENPDIFRDTRLAIEDYQLILSLAAKGTIDWMADDTLRYRIHRDSVSNSMNPAKEFRLYMSVIYIIRNLQRRHKVPDDTLHATYLELAKYLYAQVAKAKSPDLLQKLEAALKPLNLALPPSTLLRRWLMHCGIYL